jgi:hypothetical protein
MATDIEIINSALAKIRGRFITTLNDNSTEARLCKILFPRIRDRLLREVAPNFAKKRYELASLVETPVYGFDYVFQIPSDVIKILETDRYFDEDWKQENGKIYANDSTFFISVIYRVTDCEKYDPVFAEALAFALAAELATPLTNGTKLAEDMRAQAEMLMRRARSYSAQERGSIDQPEATDWLMARF